MTDPKKLISQSPGLERALLRAARDDVPPAGAPERAAVALGLAVGAPAVSVATTASATAASAAAVATRGGATLASTATTAAAAGSATKASWIAGAPWVVKTLGVLVATSVLAASVIHVAAPDARGTTPASMLDRPSLAEPTPSVRSAPAASMAISTAQSWPVAPRPSPSGATGPSTWGSPASPRPVASGPLLRSGPPLRSAPPVLANDGAATPKSSSHAIGDEIALLDRARQALDAADARESLRLLDVHDARFRDGTFAVESSVLRVEALSALGEPALALQLGERVLAAYPDEPASRHLRSLLDRIRNAPTNP
jgi:hypothetical protein